MGRSKAIQMTPFCEVSISSHNRGLYDDSNMSQSNIEGYQNGLASTNPSTIPSLLIIESRNSSQELTNMESCGHMGDLSFFFFFWLLPIMLASFIMQ